MAHKEKHVNVRFTLTQTNSSCINYNQYIQKKKIKDKLHMKVINYACFRLEEKATRSIKKNKNNVINVIGEKFAMSISWGKLAIPFCKRLFSCINYFQLLTLVTKQVTED